MSNIENKRGYKQYILAKPIEAAPALHICDGDGKHRIELLSDNPVTMPGDFVDMGYVATFPNNREYWFPQDVFEQAYRQADGMNSGVE